MNLKPFPIPATSPQLYISFKHALNLRYRWEDTGEWHFLSACFYTEERDLSEYRSIPLAGEGRKVNTNPSLASYGVREMSEILEKQMIKPATESVYVADHFRAIADIAMLELIANKIPGIANNRTINQWLDTEEQVDKLFQNYLLPLRTQLSGESLNVYRQWMETVRYE